MDYLLALLQGLGIAAAIGIRPFLPTLLVGALAAADLGLDFEGTDFAFLEQTGFLLGVVVAVAVFGIIDRRRGGDTSGDGPSSCCCSSSRWCSARCWRAGSIADVSPDWWPGLIVGAAGGRARLPGRALAVRPRPRAPGRRGRERAAALRRGHRPARRRALGPVPAAGRSSSSAALAWLLIGGRRRAGEKYAGLRILR